MLFRFAVPCFVMLSGAFILDNQKNADFKYFYSKTFIKIGLPTIMFSIYYFVYLFCLKVGGILVFDKSVRGLLEPVKQWFIGAPFYHMWYMYMMIGVYFFAPVIIRIKNEIKDKNFEILAWVFLILASIGGWTSSNMIYWDIGFQFRYVAYFIIGYVLRKKISSRTYHNNLYAVLFIAAGLSCEMISMYIRGKEPLNQIANINAPFRWSDPFCPIIVLASILIFVGFGYLKININVNKLSDDTFLIYLFHQGVWNVLGRVVPVTISIIIRIPLCIAIVFIVSLLLTRIYEKIWKKVEFHLSLQTRY